MVLNHIEKEAYLLTSKTWMIRQIFPIKQSKQQRNQKVIFSKFFFNVLVLTSELKDYTKEPYTIANAMINYKSLKNPSNICCSMMIPTICMQYLRTCCVPMVVEFQSVASEIH